MTVRSQREGIAEPILRPATGERDKTRRDTYGLVHPVFSPSWPSRGSHSRSMPLRGWSKSSRPTSTSPRMGETIGRVAWPRRTKHGRMAPSQRSSKRTTRWESKRNRRQEGSRRPHSRRNLPIDEDLGVFARGFRDEGRNNHLRSLPERAADSYLRRPHSELAASARGPADLPAAAQGKVWVAESPPGIDRFSTLYDGEERLPRARGEGFAPVESADKTTTAGQNHFSPGRFAQLAGSERGGNARHSNGRLRDEYPATGLSRSKKRTLPRTALAASRPIGRVKFVPISAWVENVLEVLDQPGEWAVNLKERKVYLWPRGEGRVRTSSPRG